MDEHCRHSGRCTIPWVQRGQPLPGSPSRQSRPVQRARQDGVSGVRTRCCQSPMPDASQSRGGVDRRLCPLPEEQAEPSSESHSDDLYSGAPVCLPPTQTHSLPTETLHYSCVGNHFIQQSSLLPFLCECLYYFSCRTALAQSAVQHWQKWWCASARGRKPQPPPCVVTLGCAWCRVSS